MKKSFTSLLPSLSDYRELRTSWRGDLLAGVTVGIVALPLALAFGVSSGAGAEAGLITAIVAGIIAAVFGGSNVQVSGPTGAMVVVLAPIVASQGIEAVAIVSLMAGVIVVIAGVLRLGRTVSYIPWPVIEGFTVGIGAIIFLQQIPAALGTESVAHSTNAVLAAITFIGAAPWPTALLPLGTAAAVIALMLVLSRISGRLPASFISIVVVTVAAQAFHLPLARIGTLPKSLPAPALPSLDLANITPLLSAALAVAALAAIESLLSARVASAMTDAGAYNADRELVGQGLASIASGFFGGMPATGAIARTAVNVRSGARTRASAVVHSLALLIVVYFAAQVVAVIPLAALSGVLMATAARMISPAVVKQVIRAGKSEAAVFIITAVITVSFDLIFAVGIGIAAAAFFALRALSASSGVHREELPGSPQPGDERIALYRVDGSLFFGAAERIIDRINDHDGIEVAILRLSQLQLIDSTGAHTLTELITTLERRGVTVLIKGIRPEHLRVLTQLGVINSLRHANHLYEQLEPAVEHARSHVRRTAVAG
ncbi:MAG: SulP family inorganic anion transporter [Rhodoglobus sp.]